MRYLPVVFSLVAMAGHAQVARAVCEGGHPTYTLDLCENSSFSGCAGNRISYKVYLNDDGEYEASVSHMDWWNERISSFDVFYDSTEWWMYDGDECETQLETGTGDRNTLSYNDQVNSLRFKAPSDKDWTILTLHVNSENGGDAHQLKLHKLGNGDGQELVIQMPRFESWWNDKITIIETGVNNNPSPRHYHWYFYKDANYSGDQVIVSDGATRDLTDEDMNDDITSFRLVITDSETPPTIEAVPTTSEWGKIALILLLMGSGTGIVLRRQLTKSAGS